MSSEQGKGNNKQMFVVNNISIFCNFLNNTIANYYYYYYFSISIYSILVFKYTLSDRLVGLVVSMSES